MYIQSIIDSFMSVKFRNAACRTSEKLLFHNAWLASEPFLVRVWRVIACPRARNNPPHSHISAAGAQETKSEKHYCQLPITLNIGPNMAILRSLRERYYSGVLS